MEITQLPRLPVPGGIPDYPAQNRSTGFLAFAGNSWEDAIQESCTPGLHYKIPVFLDPAPGKS